MKSIVLIAVLSVVAARPADLENKPVEIVSSFHDSNVDSAKWGFKSADGTSVEGQVAQTKFGDDEGITGRGAYSYKDPEGQQISLTYVADEHGFQPEGAHLSPALKRALEQIRRTNEADAKRAMMAAAAARA